MRPRRTLRHVAIVTLLSLILSPAGLLGGAPLGALPQGTAAAKPAAQPTAKPAAAKPASAAAPAMATLDGGWPRAYTTPSGATFSIHQPQVASWANQKLMTFYAAVSYIGQAGDKPALGTIKAEADTKVSVNERLVDFSVLRISRDQLSVARQAADPGDRGGSQQQHPAAGPRHRARSRAR